MVVAETSNTASIIDAMVVDLLFNNLQSLRNQIYNYLTTTNPRLKHILKDLTIEHRTGGKSLSKGNSHEDGTKMNYFRTFLTSIVTKDNLT